MGIVTWRGGSKLIIYYLLFMFLIIIGACIFSTGDTKQHRNLFAIFFFWSLSSVAFFRSFSIGEDTLNYVEWFQDFYEDGWRASFISPRRYVEPAYKILNLIIARYTNDARVLLIVVAFIILLSFTLFLTRYSKNLFLSAILFIGLNFFTNSMTAWRQFMAMSILVWMLPALFEKKWVKAGLIAILAFNFHRSSIICILSLLLAYILCKKTSFLKVVVILEIIAFFSIELMLKVFLSFVPKYSIYFSPEANPQMGKLQALIIVLEILLLYYYYFIRKDLHKEYNNFLFIIISISVVIGFLNNVVPHIFRLGYYFDFYLLLFIPIIMPKQNVIFWRVCVVVASFLLYSYYLFTNAAGIVPYTFM